MEDKVPEFKVPGYIPTDFFEIVSSFVDFIEEVDRLSEQD